MWLNTTNATFGNKTPEEMMKTQPGLEMVDEAIDALHFGNVV